MEMSMVKSCTKNVYLNFLFFVYSCFSLGLLLIALVCFFRSFLFSRFWVDFCCTCVVHAFFVDFFSFVHFVFGQFVFGPRLQLNMACAFALSFCMIMHLVGGVSPRGVQYNLVNLLFITPLYNFTFFFKSKFTYGNLCSSKKIL